MSMSTLWPWAAVIGGWALVVAGAGVLVWALFWDRARGRRRCPGCWYDMSGAVSMRCPECGRAIRSERQLFRTRRRWKWVAVAGVVFLMAHVTWCIPQSRKTGWAAFMPGVVLLAAAPPDPGPPGGPIVNAGGSDRWWLEIRERYSADANAWVLRPLSAAERWALRIGAARAVRNGTSDFHKYTAAFLLAQVDPNAPARFEGQMRATVIAACCDAAYATCSSYQDVALHKGTNGQWDEKVAYTAFRRPDRFRFEYLGRHPMQRKFTIRGEIWQEGSEPRMWWSIQPKVEKSASLDMPLASFTGVSGSLAATVPHRLLRRSASGAIGQTTLEKEEVVDGRRCHHIRRSIGGYVDDLWIDQETYGILRIERSGVLNDITVYRPRFNDAPLDEAFSFDPAQPSKTSLGDGEKTCEELRGLVGERRSGK